MILEQDVQKHKLQQKEETLRNRLCSSGIDHQRIIQNDSLLQHVTDASLQLGFKITREITNFFPKEVKENHLNDKEQIIHRIRYLKSRLISASSLIFASLFSIYCFNFEDGDDNKTESQKGCNKLKERSIIDVGTISGVLFNLMLRLKPLELPHGYENHEMLPILRSSAFETLREAVFKLVSELTASVAEIS